MQRRCLAHQTQRGDAPRTPFLPGCHPRSAFGGRRQRAPGARHRLLHRSGRRSACGFAQPCRLAHACRVEGVRCRHSRDCRRPKGDGRQIYGFRGRRQLRGGQAAGRVPAKGVAPRRQGARGDGPDRLDAPGAASSGPRRIAQRYGRPLSVRAMHGSMEARQGRSRGAEGARAASRHQGDTGTERPDGDRGKPCPAKCPARP